MPSSSPRPAASAASTRRAAPYGTPTARPAGAVTWDDFLACVTAPSPAGLNRQVARDAGQLAVVEAAPGESLFIIAGPGTGKTTALALRILKLVFVDGLDPAAVLATTFTKKAATELRSRVLGWGDTLRRALLARYAADAAAAERLRTLDLNRVVTGTLDSIAEQVLTLYRAPGSQPPIVLEDFVARAVLQRALWHAQRHKNPDLLAYAQHLHVQSRMLARDVVSFRLWTVGTHPGAAVLCDAVASYEAQLADSLTVDFAGLEQQFLEAIRDGRAREFTDTLRVILVDEYQDTNLLQEQIYLALGAAAAARGGAITIVGDDDQSLYRFRGATVELFVDFPDRLRRACGVRPRTVALSNNYRSTPAIVQFFGGFADADPDYSPARVPSKPALAAARGGTFTAYPCWACSGLTSARWPGISPRSLRRCSAGAASGSGVGRTPSPSCATRSPAASAIAPSSAVRPRRCRAAAIRASPSSCGSTSCRAPHQSRW